MSHVLPNFKESSTPSRSHMSHGAKSRSYWYSSTTGGCSDAPVQVGLVLAVFLRTKNWTFGLVQKTHWTLDQIISSGSGGSVQVQVGCEPKLATKNHLQQQTNPGVPSHIPHSPSLSNWGQLAHHCQIQQGLWLKGNVPELLYQLQDAQYGRHSWVLNWRASNVTHLRWLHFAMLVVPPLEKVHSEGVASSLLR